MSKDNAKEKSELKCIKCQFYCKKNNICTIKNTTEYTKNDIKNCRDYLIHEKYVMY